MVACSTIQRDALLNEFDYFDRACRFPTFRTMDQFAEEEIILPSGPFINLPYRIDRQPWSRHWFDLINSGLYPRYATVGPTQTGKTLTCFLIPAVYHLFERGENVGCGVPDLTMSWEKWTNDFRPVIEASRYRDLIPESGRGSKGGKFDSITFKNGASLVFVPAKGNDSRRSGKTLRVLVLTEIDKYDKASTTSKEADPITQMIARTDAFGTMHSVVFMECSVSTDAGRIWTEYSEGTASRLALQCPHCQLYVTPEREHLVGYQTATNEIDAREKSHFICPSCSSPWSDHDRESANRNSVLVHRGQEVTPEGTVTGEPPKTLTAGFRWTAANNLLRPAADIGGAEWKALNKPDDDNSQKGLLQFVWAMPWLGERAGSGITEDIVASRLNGLDRLEIPEEADTLVCQIDLHSRWHYYTLLAGTTLDPRGESKENGLAWDVVDYGVRWNPDRAKFGTEGAIRRGLELLADELEGRQYLTKEGRVIELDFVTVDGGYHQEIAVEWVTQAGRKWKVTKGQGRSDQKFNTKYDEPDKATSDIRPGDHWNYRKQPPCDESNRQPWWLILADTDYWMSQVHSAFVATPCLGPDELSPEEQSVFLKTGMSPRRSGSIAIFGTDPQIHLRDVDAEIVRSSFARQMVGWVWRSKKTTDRGTQIGWFSQWEQDHWLDTTYGCLIADNVVRRYHPRFKSAFVGPVKPDEKPDGFRMPDGRPYLITQREN